MVARVALALLAGVATAVLYARTDSANIDFEHGYESAFVEGFHPRERAEGSYFRWTDGSSFVVLHNLPPRGELTVDVRLKTVRPSGTPLPELAFTANGVTVHRARALPGAVGYRFAFPSTGETLRLGIESETFEAGGGRTLGVQVLDVTVSAAPSARWVPALVVAVAAYLWASALGSVLAGAGVTAVFIYLLARGPVPFSGYPDQILILAAVAYALARGLGLVFDRKDWLHESERSRVAALIALIAALELAVVSYPLTLSSDAEFQANRMSELLQGNWHPTSVTQHDPPFRIPYPVSLYAVAAPLAKLGLDRVPALEIVTALGDAAVSAVLILLAVRFLDDLRGGMIAAVLYQLVPMNAGAFSAGNFTNIFAVAMLALAFYFFVVANTGSGKRALVWTSVTTFLAITAHFGMLIEAAVLFPVWLLGLALVPRPVKDQRKLTAAAVVASFALAGFYYLGYWDLVTSQLGRVTSGESSASGAYQLGFINEQLGWVFCLTALLGLASVVRPLWSNPFSASALGWVLVTILFLAIEVASAVEVRYWLQALPLLALGAGRYLSLAFDRKGTGRIAAVAAIAYMSVVGLQNVRDVLLTRYH